MKHKGGGETWQLRRGEFLIYLHTFDSVLVSCCRRMFTLMTQSDFIILPQMTTANMETLTNCCLSRVCITKVWRSDLRSVYRARPYRPRSHLGPNVVAPRSSVPESVSFQLLSRQLDLKP